MGWEIGETTASVHIRRIREADFIDVLRINADCSPHVAPLDANDLHRLTARASVALVATRGIRVLGYILAFADCDDYDGEEFQIFRANCRDAFVYVDQVAVCTDARRVTVARQLYSAAQRIGFSLGAFVLGGGLAASIRQHAPSGIGRDAPGHRHDAQVVHLRGTAEIGLAVVATTFTLCAVFVPVAFMDGVPGQFFKPFAFTATIAVLFSLLVARMLTPMMASKYMKPYHEEEAPGRFMLWYLGKVRWALSHRKTTMAAVTALMIGTFFIASTLPTGLRPPPDNGFFNINASLPPGSRLQDTRAVVDAVRERLKDDKNVTRIWAIVNTRSANIGIVLVDKKHREKQQQQLQREFLARVRDIPGARFSAGGGNFGGGGLQLEITGDDSNVLAAAAAQIERELRAVPGFSNVSTSASLVQPEIVVRPRPERAAELGVTTAAISQATRIATSGDVSNNLAKMNLPDRQIPILVRLNDKARSNLDQIRLLNVPSRFGPVPLVNVADVYFGAGPAQITRYNRSRNITISADRGVIPLGQATQIARNLPAMKNLPAGVRPLETGEAEFQGRIFGSFILAMITGIFCIYALLVLLFHDVIQPVTILSALPPSAGGAFLLLWLLKMDLSLPSLIGLLMLMGIVTKNSILLVEYALVALGKGASRREAMLDACSKRARPILMTTVAMGAGMLPIALKIGADADFRAPMAIAVIGGLITSTMLTLVIVPAVFTVIVGSAAIEDAGFLGRVKRVMQRHQLERGQLGLGLPASVWRGPAKALGRFLGECESIGCSVLLDDYSLRQDAVALLRFPAVRCLKVDAHLTAHATTDRVAHAELAAIVQAARVLGLHCVAKSVASPAAASWLAALGMDFADRVSDDRKAAPATKAEEPLALERAG